MKEVIPRPLPGRMNSEACQHGAHAKALTGKGADNRRARQAQDDVDKVHQRQRELSAITRNVEGRLFYLAVHVRNTTGQLSLRWRHSGSARITHMAWHEMEGLFQRLPSMLADWYRTADRMARALNQEEQMARTRLRQVRETMEQDLRNTAYSSTTR